MKSNINWNSPIMRRYGQSIRQKIFEAYRAAIKADELRKIKDEPETPVWYSNKQGKC
jgi:hypothetical protein